MSFERWNEKELLKAERISEAEGGFEDGQLAHIRACYARIDALERENEALRNVAEAAEIVLAFYEDDEDGEDVIGFALEMDRLRGTLNQEALAAQQEVKP